jgi:hypothetical protein
MSRAKGNFTEQGMADPQPTSLHDMNMPKIQISKLYKIILNNINSS